MDLSNNIMTKDEVYTTGHKYHHLLPAPLPRTSSRPCGSLVRLYSILLHGKPGYRLSDLCLSTQLP
jgi:hypothetical protein